jgi:hypothetical protein
MGHQFVIKLCKLYVPDFSWFPQAKWTDLHNNDLHSEKELLLRVSMGDEVAYSQLFRKYWPQVYGTGLRLTRSPEQAKDLAQEMFLKLWDNRDKLPGVQKLDSFLYTSSRNLIMDHLKKKVLNVTNIEFLIDYFRNDAISAQEKAGIPGVGTGNLACRRSSSGGKLEKSLP